MEEIYNKKEKARVKILQEKHINLTASEEEHEEMIELIQKGFVKLSKALKQFEKEERKIRWKFKIMKLWMRLKNFLSK